MKTRTAMTRGRKVFTVHWTCVSDSDGAVSDVPWTKTLEYQDSVKIAEKM